MTKRQKKQNVQEGPVGRRDFLKMAAVAGAGMALGGAGGFVISEAVNPTTPVSPETSDTPVATGKGISAYPRVQVASLSALKQGEPVYFDYPLKGLTNILVKLGAPAEGGVGPEQDVVAYSVHCTHMGCSLVNFFNSTHNVLGPCPCHFTTFDLAQGGMPVIGCATESLPRVQLALDDSGSIFATGVNGLIYGHRDNLRDRPAL